MGDLCACPPNDTMIGAMGRSYFFLHGSHCNQPRVPAKHTQALDKEELVLTILVVIQRHFIEMVA